MICPNCGKNNKDSYNFCNSCGEKLDIIYKPNITSDEDYVKKYVGEKYDIIKQERFSILAFIFGPLHMIYRKMYLYGLSLLTIIVLLSYYNIEIGSYITIIINLYLGFKFNRIYMNHANQKTEEIKISNPDKTSQELLDLCKRKGSTINPIILIMIITTTLTIILIYTIDYIRKNQIVENNTNNYNEIVDMKYKVLDNYKKGQFKSTTYDFYSYHKDNTSCYITIKTTPTTNYKSIDDYIIKYSKTNNEITNIQINNNNWKKTINNKLTIYAINYNNNYYLIKFDSNDKTCINNESIFMNNITFKGTK